MSASRRVGLVLLAAAVIVGAWLRFTSLGRLSPWDDEFPHMIAGRSVVEHGRPELPSGRSYRRALAQTVAVGGAMKIFGDDEGAARVPSAVAGVATIPLAWALTRRRFGQTAALAAAVSVALSPLYVAHARSARFYAAFALAYGLAVYFGTRAVRTGQRRHVVAAVLSFAAALHLQSLALLIVVPFAADLALQSRGESGPLRERARLVLLLVCGVVVAAAVAVAVAALAGGGWGDGFVRSIRLPVPGVGFDPGFHLNTLGRLFTGVFPWAWMVLGPAAIVGLRRAGRDGAALAMHAGLPALLLSLLYRRLGAHPRGIDVRYLIHLRLLLAIIAGIGVAEVVRRALRVVPHENRRRVVAPIACAAIAAVTVAGIGAAFRIPTEGHPGQVIPRANWRAAAATVRPDLSPGDALLTTSPLASSWYLGRCGSWLRSKDAAAPYVDGDRDVYCGSEILSDFAATRAFMSEHPRGWVLADAWWDTEVDSSVRAFIEARAIRVPVPDATVIVYRWGEAV